MKNDALPSIFSSFLGFGVVMALIVFGVRVGLQNPKMIIAAYLGVFITFIFIKSPAWGLAILIFLGTNFGGLMRLHQLPSISLPGFGSLLLYDVVLLLFLGILILSKSLLLRSRITPPLLLLLGLTALEGVLSVLKGVDPHYVTLMMRPFAFYAVYFLLVGAIRTERDLKLFLKLLLIIAVFSASVTYYQAITGNAIIGEDKRYLADYGLYQTLNVGSIAQVCVFLMLFSWLTGTKKQKYHVHGLLLLSCIGGALVIMFVKSLWGSLLIAMLVINLLNRAQTIKTIAIQVFLVIVVFVGFSVLKEQIGSAGLDYILKDRIDRLEVAYKNRADDMMRTRMEHFFEEPSLFGYGFKGRRDAVNDAFDPTVISLHNLPGDIAALYGASGFFVFAWLFWGVFRQAFRLVRRLSASWQKSVAVAMLAFHIQAVIMGVASNVYYQTTGIIVIVSSWGVLEVLDQCNKQEQKDAIHL